MPELDSHQTPDSGVVERAVAPPAAPANDEAFASSQAISQAELDLRNRARLPRKNWGLENLKLRVALAVALVLVVVAGSLVGYGVIQGRAARQRQAAAVLAKQLEADKQSQARLDAQRKADAASVAAQAQASKEASQQATIADGKFASAQIVALKAARTELTNVIDALKKKATSSASASRAWDSSWNSRQASYASRRSAVLAHNASERSRYLGSRVETSSKGRLVIKYSYHPSYQAVPGGPSRPAPLSVSVSSERARLSALQKRIGSLRSTIASHTPTGPSFTAIYPVLDSTAKSLAATVGSASSMAGSLVVSSGSKGHVIAASKISSVKLSALDAPFGALDSAFSSAVTAAGLTPAQVAGG
jgi:type II secretory pathway pseudopilin PulG